MRKVVTMVKRIAATIAASDGNSANGCRTSEVMPRTVAIAPGPNINGIANGTNATVSPVPAGAFGIIEAGKNKVETKARILIGTVTRRAHMCHVTALLEEDALDKLRNNRSDLDLHVPFLSGNARVYGHVLHGELNLNR